MQAAKVPQKIMQRARDLARVEERRDRIKEEIDERAEELMTLIRQAELPLVDFYDEEGRYHIYAPDVKEKLKHQISRKKRRKTEDGKTPAEASA